MSLSTTVSEVATFWDEQQNQGSTPSLEALAGRFPSLFQGTTAHREVVSFMEDFLELTGAREQPPLDPREQLPSDPRDIPTVDRKESKSLTKRFPDNFPEVQEPPGFSLLGSLGKGGMGVVYKALQTRLNREVALKMILRPVGSSSTERIRFDREAKAIAQLRHPNIVQIYESEEHLGQPYFALELVNGGSLHEMIKGTPQPPDESALVVERIAIGMQHAHAHDIIHRDLKPANVLMSSEGEQEGDKRLSSFVPKVTDFGLAKQINAEESVQTFDGAVMGTPSYMAPEQAEGRIRELDARTDVYALGGILYEMLTGR